MKITSEITGKEYPTVEACLKAEKVFKAEEEKKLANTSKRKKELASKVELADKQLSEANKLYEIAKTKATEILEKANKEVKEILTASKEQVKKAEEDKFNAVMEFNKEFGVYTTTVTGEKAAEELEKSLKRFDEIFSPFNFFRGLLF